MKKKGYINHLNIVQLRTILRLNEQAAWHVMAVKTLVETKVILSAGHKMLRIDRNNYHSTTQSDVNTTAPPTQQYQSQASESYLPTDMVGTSTEPSHS